MKPLEEFSRDERKAMRRKIAGVFEKYRLYKYLTFEEREANITASYEPRFHGKTNKVADQTSQVAIYNADMKREREAFCKLIEQAVERLPEQERILLMERYMGRDADYITDQNVYNFKFDPPISPVTYAKIRDRAMYKLLLLLNIPLEGDKKLKLTV